MNYCPWPKYLLHKYMSCLCSAVTENVTNSYYLYSVHNILFIIFITVQYIRARYKLGLWMEEMASR